jgi:lipopolysaccharide transport system ATP-binding protein
VSLETLDENGLPTQVWQSGRPVSVAVRVRFERAVADPVVGIMLRTRIGFEVYGTNTELEGLRLGPCQAGETLRVTFSFPCDLCPREYTLTAASHDPDGVWHDWLEDALAFSVVDERYTAGVANLRARVRVERTG